MADEYQDEPEVKQVQVVDITAGAAIRFGIWAGVTFGIVFFVMALFFALLVMPKLSEM